MAKNTSFPPIKDGVKADNTTYSSNKIEEIASAIESEIPALPEPAVEDINKVIGITSDGSTGAEYGLISIENELPVPEVADIGKLAGVISDGSTGAEYGLVNAPAPDNYSCIITATIGTASQGSYPLTLEDSAFTKVKDAFATNKPIYIELTNATSTFDYYPHIRVPMISYSKSESEYWSQYELQCRTIGDTNGSGYDLIMVFVSINDYNAAGSLTRKMFTMQ